MLRVVTIVSVLMLVGCVGSTGPLLGIIGPNAIETRYLKLSNESRGYVVFRVVIPGAEPLVTPLMPPGAEVMHEMGARLGTLCPESLRVEIAAYARLRPELSPFEDETPAAAPCASLAVELMPGQHFGCSAEPIWVDLGSTITISVLEVDEQAGAIGFEAGWLPTQRRTGLDLDDPPAPAAPEMFLLNGRLVNLNAEPVVHAEIRFPQLGASVFTDARGRFRVLRPAGVYLIEPVLDDIMVSPVVRAFTHISSEQVPIEFIALTDTLPVFALPGGQP